MRELKQLLPELQPPAGGLARLRHSVQTRGKRREPVPWRWLPVATACSTLAILAMAWLPGYLQQQRRVALLTHALHTATAPLPGGIRVADGAAMALPSDQPDVRIYLVQTMPTAATKNGSRRTQGLAGMR